jgi:tetratricopeptide (TPR) repeat protein
LKTGRNDLALADAEESLKEDRKFTKGLYQKAEALYAMGEFELALVFYHRGKKLRGDVKEFQLGINKAQEAIDNCVGGSTFRNLISSFLYSYISVNIIRINRSEYG